MRVAIEPGSRLVGLCSHSIDATSDNPVPILQRPSNNRIVEDGQHEPLLATPSRITGTRWYPANELLVWRAQSGELGVDAVNPHRVQLRLRPEGSPPG